MLAFRGFARAKGMQRRLLKRLGRTPALLEPRPLPRRIWMFWAQGLDEAPPLVRHCVAAWREKNPGWEVRLLTMADLPSLVDMDDVPAPPATSYQAFSDLLRLRLLNAHGGVWADPTCLPVRPLDQWLAPLMQAGFFAFDRPHPERMLASWFLASEPGGVVVAKWAAASGRYLASVRKPDDYFWLHYLFEWLVRNDPAFRRAWSRVPKVSADGPHYLIFRLQAGAAIDPARAAATPMQKLDWRRDYDEADLRRWGGEAP